METPPWWPAWQRVRREWVVPGGATILAMALCFTVVAALLLAWEVLILDATWTRWAALAVMYVLPHLAVGAWVGRTRPLAVGPPVAAGLAPVLMLVFGLLLFGGPVATPLRAPLVTAGAVLGWTGLFALGMVAGSRLDGAAEQSN